MNIKIMINKIKHFFSAALTLKNTDRHPVYYRISSVDPENQTAILHLIHKSIFIKHTFAEIISDPEIIEGLSCQQACWLGVYYGKALRSALDGKTKLKNIKKPTYLLQHKYGCYKIVSENRDGTIECIHVKTRKEINAHPILIAEDNTFIKHFDANQACYIGILAGIAMEKNEALSPKEIKRASVPYLRIVK